MSSVCSSRSLMSSWSYGWSSPGANPTLGEREPRDSSVEDFLPSPCPPSVTMVCGLFNLLPLPMSSTDFLVPSIVITVQPNRTSFLSSPHSYVAFPQSTFNLLPCWLLETSSTNMIILYFSFYDSVILRIQLFLFSICIIITGCLYS